MKFLILICRQAVHVAHSVWAAGKASGEARFLLHSHLTCAIFLWFFCVSVSAAFLGDIALDEEDLRSFKVDRIIDLASRTVRSINRTSAGKEKKKMQIKTEFQSICSAITWSVVALGRLKKNSSTASLSQVICSKFSRDKKSAGERLPNIWRTLATSNAPGRTLSWAQLSLAFEKTAIAIVRPLGGIGA